MQIENSHSLLVLLHVWFALAWRSFLWILLFLIPAFILGVGLAVVVGLVFGFQKEAASSFGGILGGIFGFAAAIFDQIRALQATIGKKYSGYRLLLVKD